MTGTFPGFDVSPHDFVELNGEIFRVNSNGTKHSLTKWHFDEKTGEFYRVTGRDEEAVFFEPRGYGERRVLVHSGKILHVRTRAG